MTAKYVLQPTEEILQGMERLFSQQNNDEQLQKVLDELKKYHRR
jgi:hypothetical protein